MVMMMAAFDDDHLLVVAVATIPAVMAMHLGASAAILTVMMSAMHSAIAGLDNDSLRAGYRRHCNGKCSNGRNNKTKLLHFCLSPLNKARIEQEWQSNVPRAAQTFL
jgi:hypothetical protein